MPERLARVDVREVHLDGGQPRDLDRVAQRPRIVCPRARVEDQPVGEVGRLVQLLHELGLVVGLEEARLQPELAPEARDLVLELGVREPAVVLCRAPVERAQVDPVQDGDAALHRNPASAARTSLSATGTPVRTSPSASTSTNPTRPPRRFLSRWTAASTASWSTSGSSAVGSPRSPNSSATSPRSSGRPDRVSAESSPSPTASPW